MPASGTLPPNSDVSPTTSALGRGSGSESGSTWRISHSSGSHLRSRMSNSSVREALVKSVTCSPQSLCASQESIVPKRASPWPSLTSHSILVPEK